MKKIISTIALSLMVGFVFAQATEQNPNAPKIEFEQKVIDYGTIEKGADGKRVFSFTNTGKEPLIITNAKGSCGCTVPSWPREPIAPGATAEIKVKYDTNRPGPFQKSVTVNSNASNGTQLLRIKGKVIKEKPVKTTPENEKKNSVMVK